MEDKEINKKIPEYLRYRLLADGGIFDRIQNKEVGMIWSKSDQGLCFELRGKEKQEFMRGFISQNEK